MKKSLVFLMMCIMTTGCGAKAEKTAHTPVGKIPCTIYTEVKRSLAPMEKDKCMSGAYISEDIPYNEIDDFEKKIQAENDIYVYFIEKGEDFPMSFAVNCYAKNKIPMLVLGPESSYEQIMSIALACGSLNLPMFIEMDYNNEIEMFDSHSALFRGYAPKAVLVYGFDCRRESRRLPKEKSFDWIAVNACEEMSNGTVDTEYGNISKWCGIYKDKTLMVNISVPVFTDDKCNYAIDEACNEIENIYSLADSRSNIGAVNYISISRSEGGIRKYSSRLSENDSIMNAYGKAVRSVPDKRYYSSTTYIGYVIGERVLVDDNTALMLGAECADTEYSNVKALVNYSLDREGKKIYLR